MYVEPRVRALAAALDRLQDGAQGMEQLEAAQAYGVAGVLLLAIWPELEEPEVEAAAEEPVRLQSAEQVQDIEAEALRDALAGR